MVFSVKTALPVMLGAVLVMHFGSDPHIAKESSVRLGEAGYAYKELHAPVATGTVLRAFSWLLTQTPLGPLVRRHLLDSNGISTLRELAAQIPEVQPLTTPMLRHM